MEQYFHEPENKPVYRDGIEFFLQRFTVASVDTPIVRAHIHSAIEILFIDSGDFLIYADDIPYQVGPGDTVLLRSKTIHRIYSRQTTECSYYVLKINPSLICDFSFPDQGYRYLIRFAINDRHSKTLWTCRESRDCGILQALDGLKQEHKRRSFGFDFAMKLHAAAILLAMLRSITTAPEQDSSLDNENIVRRIYNAMLYINAHYSENLTAEDCSSQAFMSYSYFSRCFRRVSGKSFKEYLNQVRINHAEKALLSGESSITEIASSCGFNSVSYFISTYKKIKGITPLEFRKLNQP